MPYGAKGYSSYARRTGFVRPGPGTFPGLQGNRNVRSSRSMVKGRRKVPRRGKSSAAIVRQPSGLADRLYVKLRLVFQFSSTGTAGQNTFFILLGNGMFDPLGVAGSTRPYLFDQWAQFYQNYKVFASKVRVRATCNGGSNASSMFSIFPSNKLQAWGTTDQLIMETMPYCRTQAFRMGAVGAGNCEMKHYMSTAKIFGEKKNIVENDENYWGTQGSDPAAPWYWYLMSWDQGGNNNSVIANVTCTYYCVFSKRDLTAPSPPP